jgi:hypothetical protein
MRGAANCGSHARCEFDRAAGACDANPASTGPAGDLLATGTYSVAVSCSGFDPQSRTGAIWIPLVGSQRAPDGPGAALTLASWAGSAMVQPLNPYHVAFANIGYCAAAVPTLRSTWGAEKSHYR